MSGMTQFVVADKGSEEAISNHAWPNEEWIGCDGFKFFGRDELGHLYATVLGGTETYEHFPILCVGDRGWVYEVPITLVAILAEADDDILVGFAQEWSARMAELPNSEYLPEELLWLLHEIRPLVVSAKVLGQSVYLWHSLAC